MKTYDVVLSPHAILTPVERWVLARHFREAGQSLEEGRAIADRRLADPRQPLLAGVSASKAQAVAEDLGDSVTVLDVGQRYFCIATGDRSRDDELLVIVERRRARVIEKGSGESRTNSCPDEEGAERELEASLARLLGVGASRPRPQLRRSAVRIAPQGFRRQSVPGPTGRALRSREKMTFGSGRASSPSRRGDVLD